MFDLFTFLLISAAILILDELQTPCPNKAYACFQKLLKISQHNSPPSCVYVLSNLTLDLFTWVLQSSFFSLRREGLDLEGLSLRERKFDLR